MKILRKAKSGMEVPTSSMADIAFLLLVFFMVTTVLKLEEGLPVVLPKAEAAESVPREKVVHIWVSSRGDIVINDALINMNDIEPIIAGRLLENRELIVAFNVDSKTPYGIVSDIIDQLKRASASRASFTSKKERPQ